MTFGARPFGSRSFGDSAPSGAGVMDPTSEATALTVDSAAIVVAAATATFNTKLVAQSAAVVVTSTGLTSAGAGTAGGGVSIPPAGVAPGGPAAGSPAYPAEVVEPPFQFSYRHQHHGGRLTPQEMAQRDRELEDFITDQVPDLVWTRPGALEETTSPPFFIRNVYRLFNWVVMLGTAGTSETRLRLLVTDEPVLELIIPAGETLVQAVNHIDVVPNSDVVKLVVVTPGLSAADLTVQAEVRKVWRQYASNFN